MGDWEMKSYDHYGLAILISNYGLKIIFIYLLLMVNRFLNFISE